MLRGAVLKMTDVLGESMKILSVKVYPEVRGTHEFMSTMSTSLEIVASVVPISYMVNGGATLLKAEKYSVPCFATATTV